MTSTVYPSLPTGTVKAISSKSVAHRLLICAAFADKKTVIRCDQTNRDIDATVACLSALGAVIVRKAPFFEVTPVSPINIRKNAVLPCGESGSTLRFLLPIVAALGADSSFIMEGRLPMRPLSPLRELLEANGIELSAAGSNPLSVKGKLLGRDFSIAGNISSQFISGMLLALSLLPHSSKLSVTGKTESAPYINITLDALSVFGAAPERQGNSYMIAANQVFISPQSIEVEGDWSNAAFPLCLGVLGKGSVTVTDLNTYSSQGDMKIIELIKLFGGKIIPAPDGKGYIATSSALCGIDIDAAQTPDLVPILATLASVAKGQTRIYGAERLRLKESDRLESVRDMLSSLGADIQVTDTGLIINGKSHLKGGRVNSYNDHRIAMSAAVAATVCDEAVIIDGAECVSKSYPSFWQDMISLNIKLSRNE